MTRYNQSPIGRGLQRLDLAADALTDLHRALSDVFPPPAEIHMNDVSDLISQLRAKITRARVALEGIDGPVVAPALKLVPSIPASQTESVL